MTTRAPTVLKSEKRKQSVKQRGGARRNTKTQTQKMSEKVEIYTAGKNLTLPPAVTGWTNSTSDSDHDICENGDGQRVTLDRICKFQTHFCSILL